MLDAKKVYIKLKKEIIGVASGIKNITSSGNVITFETNAGTKHNIIISAGVIDVVFTPDDGILKIKYADGTSKDVNLQAYITEKEIPVNTESSVWQLQHNLNTKTPTILCFDTDGTCIGGEIRYDTATLNYIEVAFCIPIAGKAIIKK